MAIPTPSSAQEEDPVADGLDSSGEILRDLREGRYRTGLRVGSLSGPNAFGLIESVEAADGGRFHVLDSRGHRLLMYGPDGELLDEAGGVGQGPGELSSPEDLVVTGDGRVMVVDRTRRVEVFRRVGDSLRHERRFRILSAPWDACVIGDRLVVQTVRHASRKIIDVYDFRGRRLRSFGEMSPGEALLDRETFSWGNVACLPGGRIVYVPRSHNRVAAFTLTGDQLWQVEMPDYRPVTVMESSDEKPGRGYNWTSPDGTHSAVRVVALPDGDVVAVHLGLRDTTSTGSHDYQRRRALFYEAETGELLWDTDEVPPFDGITADRFFGVRQLPYPTVTVYRRPGGS